MASPKPTARPRHRITADVPESTDLHVRQVAALYYRGVLSDAVSASLETFRWVLDALQRGKRVIAVDADRLPDGYEEPLIAGLPRPEGDWVWLVRRDHPWRRQLWIKGRNLTAGDLARTIEIERWTPEEAAVEYELPLEAVIEAQRYAEAARDLIAAEEAENRIVAQRYERSVAALP
ncbi:MAG TPA: hypothetical protein VFK38_00600 [Candidatus Limnocylindrales bacterium]|nr:hypothetical protein [Candidatus Limnocylindrales bacterium]